MGAYGYMDLIRHRVALSKAEGETRSLFTVLAARGFDITPEVRQQLDWRVDPDNIQPQISKAVTVSNLNELFDWRDEEDAVQQQRGRQIAI